MRVTPTLDTSKPITLDFLTKQRMSAKEKNERLSLALRKSKRKLFQKKIKRKINNVSSFRQMD